MVESIQIRPRSSPSLPAHASCFPHQKQRPFLQSWSRDQLCDCTCRGEMLSDLSLPSKRPGGFYLAHWREASNYGRYPTPVLWRSPGVRHVGRSNGEVTWGRTEDLQQMVSTTPPDLWHQLNHPSQLSATCILSAQPRTWGSPAVHCCAVIDPNSGPTESMNGVECVLT